MREGKEEGKASGSGLKYVFVHITIIRMKTKLPTTQAARNLGDCLARIRYRGESFVLTKNNRPVAELGPVAGDGRATLRELWGAVWSKSVDDGFADDLERVNKADTALNNPWEA